MMRLGLICNNAVAIPALQLLLQEGVCLYVGIDIENKALAKELAPYMNALPENRVMLFTRKDFAAQLGVWLAEIQPVAVLLMTCPFRIPAAALAVPSLGFINFHYGLLPEYRGANPVFEQIKQRAPYGGISIHKVDEQIDKGPIIYQTRVPLHPDETFGSHMERLAALGAKMLATMLPELKKGQPLPDWPQDDTIAHYYKRPVASDVTVQWETMSAADIVALANACNPWNYGAATSLHGVMLGLNKASVREAEPVKNLKAGTIISIDTTNGLAVATADGNMLLIEILYFNNTFTPGHKLAEYNIIAGMAFT